MPAKRLAVMLDEDIHTSLKVTATKLGLDMSDVVRNLVKQWLDQQLPPLGFETPEPPQDQDEQVE